MPESLFGADLAEAAEGVMEKIVHRLAAEGHDLGDVFGVGVHIEAEIDDLLLAAGEAGEGFSHLTGEIGEVFFADEAAPDGRGAVEEVFELGFDGTARAADGPRQVMTEGLEEVVFDEGGLADGKPVDPKSQEKVLDTVFDKLGIFCETGAVIEQILVVSVHQFAEGIGVAVAELVPEKEVFVQ
jgi:hypothetical protein